MEFRALYMEESFKLRVVSVIELIRVLLLSKARDNREEQYGECKKKVPSAWLMAWDKVIVSLGLRREI
jgi:hypothetical protein